MTFPGEILLILLILSKARSTVRAEKARAPFCTGKFTALIDGQRIDKPEFARDLPGFALREHEVAQTFRAGFMASITPRHTGHDGFAALRIAARHAEDEAFLHGGMRREETLDRFR